MMTVDSTILQLIVLLLLIVICIMIGAAAGWFARYCMETKPCNQPKVSGKGGSNPPRNKGKKGPT